MRLHRHIWAVILLLLSLCAEGGGLFRPGRVVVHYYRCELDGTDQPYSAWLPRDYDPGRKWPLVVQLHGLGGTYRIGGVRREIEDCVVVAPDGRGSTDYKLWGELDIVRVVDDAKKRYSIDDNRVALWGTSMGGSGSWQVGVHFPDLFAALGPVCGNADHRVWERLWNWGETHPTWMSPKKRWVEATESPAFFAENLINLPSWPIHGDRDNVVPVGHSQSMAAELEKAGAECRYVEVPGAGHGVPGDKVAEMLTWLKTQRRDPWPKRVVFKTAWRRHPGAYWVRIHRFERPFAFARIEAEALDRRSARVTTENVEELSLRLVPQLFDQGQAIRLELNGEASQRRAGPDGWLRLRKQGRQWLPSTEPTSLHKTPHIEGPITHAFMTPFVIVYGTAGTDERAKRVAREEAKILADRWNRWARGRARVKADRDIKPRDIDTLNLVLVGDPACNSLIPRVTDKLPIRIESKAIVFGDQRFEGDDLGVKMVYPNPLNPTRYVALFSGTTWRGVYQIVGRFGNWFDWGILDGWHWMDFAVFDDRSYSPETFLAVGFFDNDWKLNPDWTVTGDKKLRLARPPRRTPPLRQPPADAGQLYLSDLEPASVRPEKGIVARDRSFNAFPLTLGGRTFERGLGVHPNCDIAFDLHGRFPTFEAVVGSDLEGEEAVSEARDKVESFEFMVIGDGKMIYQTGRMRWDHEPRHIYVPIAGVRRLELKIHRRSGPRWLGGPVDWAIAKVGEPIHNSEAVRAKVEGPATLTDTVELNGAWKLAAFPVGEGIAHGAHRGERDAMAEAIDADVPGSVFAALHAAGQLDALRDEAASREWWLWRQLDVPRQWAGRSAWLELDGAAYQADAWLNGRWIGRTVGPFAVGRLDATQGLKLGERNVLAVRVVASPAEWAKGGRPFRPARPSSLVTSQELARAGYPVLGLWRPVRLRSAGPLRLRDLHVEATGADERNVLLRVEAEIESLVNDKLKGRLKGTIAADGADAPTGTLGQDFELDGHRTARLEVVVPCPKHGLLWRPLGQREGHGSHLHQLEAAVELDGGAVWDAGSVRFGIRSVELDTSSESARVVVNGQPLTVRGVVWMPADGLLRPDKARIRRLLERARQCGFNTLRVWGGGLAESDAFYDLCDEMGFLVLQELPLTSGEQSGAADDFLRNCSDTVRRLRRHPSLVAWCVGGSVRPGGVPEPRLTAEVAALCGRLDPQRRLIADSPKTGRAQLWTTRTDPTTRRTYWRGAAIAYTPGVASPSMPGTLEAQLGRTLPWPAGGRWPTSGAAGPSRSARDHILKAQVAQAAALQRAVDHRRAAPASEVLWQLNEPLPSSSPALVDAAGVPKPAFYALRRARAPLAVFADFGGAAPTTLAPSDRLRGEVCAQSRARPLAGLLASAAVLDHTLRPLAAWQATVRTDGTTARPILLDWRPDASLVGNVVFLHLALRDAAGQPLATSLYWFGIAPRKTEAKPPRLRVAWLTSRPRGPLADEAFLAAAGIALERPEHQAPEPPPKPDKKDKEEPEGLFDDAPDEEEIEAAEPKLQLDGYDALVVDPATVLDDYTDTDLQQVAEAVANGAGLLVDGTADGLAASSLEPLLPLGYRAPMPTGVGRQPAPADPAHPALSRLAFAGAPVLPRRPAVELKGAARAVLRLDRAHPLLAEARHGRGRVMQFAIRADRELAAWDDLPRLYAGILGYLASLPHHQQAALVDAARPAPLRGLDRLGPAHVEASARQDGDAVVVELTNPSAALAFMVHLEPQGERGVPPPVLLSDNFVSMLPGERRRIRIEADPLAPAGDAAPIGLMLRGWNVPPRRLDAHIAIRDGRLSLRRP